MRRLLAALLLAGCSLPLPAGAVYMAVPSPYYGTLGSQVVEPVVHVTGQRGAGALHLVSYRLAFKDAGGNDLPALAVPATPLPQPTDLVPPAALDVRVPLYSDAVKAYDGAALSCDVTLEGTDANGQPASLGLAVPIRFLR